MAVPSVFISSVITGFEQVREGAATAVDGMGMYPIRSEKRPAAADSPRRALLDDVADADIYLLLLGARYGDVAPSPTEEEYEEAVRLHRTIIVLKQRGEMDEEQRAFLERVTAGGWTDGALYGEFDGPEDVGAAVAAALSRYQSGIVESGPQAQERARQLVQRDQRGYTGGVDPRVAFVPLRQTTVLDPVGLEDPELGDRLAAALRQSGAVPQSVGLSQEISASGVALDGNEAIDWTTPSARVLADGSITVTGAVPVQGQLGVSSIDPGRLEDVLRSAGRFAQLAWEIIDSRAEIRQVAVACSVPGQAGFGIPTGNTMITGGMTGSIPETVIAPDPPAVAPITQLADDDHLRRVVAGVRRVFADGGAIQP